MLADAKARVDETPDMAQETIDFVCMHLFGANFADPLPLFVAHGMVWPQVNGTPNLNFSQGAMISSPQLR